MGGGWEASNFLGLQPSRQRVETGRLACRQLPTQKAGCAGRVVRVWFGPAFTSSSFDFGTDFDTAFGLDFDTRLDTAFDTNLYTNYMDETRFSV